MRNHIPADQWIAERAEEAIIESYSRATVQEREDGDETMDRLSIALDGMFGVEVSQHG